MMARVLVARHSQHAMNERIDMGRAKGSFVRSWSKKNETANVPVHEAAGCRLD